MYNHFNYYISFAKLQSFKSVLIIFKVLFVQIRTTAEMNDKLMRLNVD